jgi:hypothetical protein
MLRVRRFAPVRAAAGRLFALAWLCGAALLAGCEEDVHPFIGTNLPFSVYGLVNPKADTHAVRVFTIDDELRLVSPDPIDAVVSLLHPASGERFFWQDSVIRLPNMDYRHVFWLAEPVIGGERYRLEVERSDGVVTRSEDVTVPLPIAIEIVPTDEQALSTLELPINLIGEPPALPRIELVYDTYSVNSAGIRQAELPVLISYTGQQIRREEGGWSLTITLRDDFRLIARTYAERELPSEFICAVSLRLDVHVGNAEWVSPIGVFDENFLVEPGTLNNIENGFGFFGAGFVETVTWLPPQLILLQAGFDECATSS